jgi:hypothetical protein
MAGEAPGKQLGAKPGGHLRGVKKTQYPKPSIRAVHFHALRHEGTSRSVEAVFAVQQVVLVNRFINS